MCLRAVARFSDARQAGIEPGVSANCMAMPQPAVTVVCVGVKPISIPAALVPQGCWNL